MHVTQRSDHTDSMAWRCVPGLMLIACFLLHTKSHSPSFTIRTHGTCTSWGEMRDDGASESLWCEDRGNGNERQAEPYVQHATGFSVALFSRVSHSLSFALPKAAISLCPAHRETHAFHNEFRSLKLHQSGKGTVPHDHWETSACADWHNGANLSGYCRQSYDPTGRTLVSC